MREEPAHEPHPDLRQGYVVFVRRGQVLPSVRVPDAQMDVQTVAGPIRKWLRHQRGDHPVLAGDVMERGTKLEIAIDCLDRGAMLDRRFVLARPVLLMQLRDRTPIPASSSIRSTMQSFALAR